MGSLVAKFSASFRRDIRKKASKRGRDLAKLERTGSHEELFR